MLHERDDLLAVLAERLASAARGRGHVVLVGGEPGIGKTSLLRTFAESCGARVLWGGCEALATPRPFGPMHDFLRRLGRHAREAFAGDAGRSELFVALLDDLAATPSPTVLVIDDLHWADEATLDLVKFIGRRVHSVPVLLVLAHRDDVESMARLRPVIGDLPRDDVTRFCVPTLTVEAVRAMSQAAGRSAEGVHEATAGNPFFVTEALAHAGAGVPPTVRDAVLARAQRLGPATRDVVELAAIVPRRIELALLEAVLAPTSVAVQAALDAGILELSGNALAFRHELARAAIESGLGPLRARSLHAQVLAVLRSGTLGEPALARLVHHGQNAQDTATVSSAAPLAAREAARRGARREAVAHCRTALACAAQLDDSERARLLADYATYCFAIGDLDEAIPAGEEAAALFAAAGDVASQVESLAELAMPLVRALRNGQADEASRRAVALAHTLPPGPARAKAYTIESYLRMLNRELGEAVAWGEQAVALARTCAAPEIEAASLVPLGAAVMFLDFERGCALLERAITLARPLARGDAIVADAYMMLGSAAGENNRFDDAERWLAEGLAHARARDLDRVAGYMAGWQALCDLARGRWDSAGERAHALIGRETLGSTNRLTALIALGRLRVRRGDPGASAVLDEALALAERSGTLQRLAPVCAARAEAAWLAADLSGVLAEVRRAYDLAVVRQHPWFAGELAYWRSHVEAATIPDPCAEPWRLQLEGRWREAADAWASAGCPYESARALAQGDEAARREALPLLDRLGARPLAERVRAELRASGAVAVPRGPRATTRANAAGLTAREMQVLELLAQGRRSGEIAQSLSRSPRTVEHHVEAIVIKLQAADRDAAVAAARRLGLLSDQK